MHDNNTVQQLSDALNELLNAYDKLKNENTNLKDDNSSKDNKISELETRNRDLEEQIEKLTDTTVYHTHEIDTMLGRIKTILDDTPENKEDQSEEFSVQKGKVFSSIDEELNEESNEESTDINPADEKDSVEELKTSNIEQDDEKEKSNSDREIDLGRMQSLLNGFNN